MTIKDRVLERNKYLNLADQIAKEVHYAFDCGRSHSDWALHKASALVLKILISEVELIQKEE